MTDSIQSSIGSSSGPPFDHVWYWKPQAMRPIDRRGSACRVLVRAPRMNSVLVEFLDGFRVVCSRHAVRKSC